MKKSIVNGMREQTRTYLTFSINEHAFALPLKQVNRVIRAVAVKAVPESSNKVHGVINYHGKIVPLINLRECLGMGTKEISSNDRFLLLDTPKRLVAIAVDAVENVKEINDSELSSIELPCNDQYKKNTIPLKHHRIYGDEEGIIVIYDVEELLNAKMTIQIEKVMDSFLKTNKESR